MDDVIVIGGGVIGLSIALELAEQGVAVAVFEQGDFGREASWAGAGILPPGNLTGADSPESQLRALSHLLWDGWAQSLSAATGIDIGYRRCGGLEVRAAESAALRHEISAWRQEGVRVEEIRQTELHDVEPQLAPAMTVAYRLPELGQVRNPRLIQALLARCRALGVRLCPGTPVVGFDEGQGEILSIRTPSDLVRAGRFCVAGGPWSRSIVASLGAELAIEPIRGQIVLLSQLPAEFSHVIQLGPRYLVPRSDGRVLIGATEERAGFLKENTAIAVSELLAFGVSVLPVLAQARFERAWSGLRPGSADGLPYLGRVAGFENLFLAAGHFRSGLQMSPGTARLLRQCLLDCETEIPLEPFASDRPRPGAGVVNAGETGASVAEHELSG